MVTRVASLLRSSLRSRVVRTAVVAVAVASGWGLSLSAQQAPLRKIGELELAIRGLTATTESRLTVPKNVPSGVRVAVNAGAAAVAAADAVRLLGGPFRIEAELAGPGLSETLPLPDGPPDADPFLLRLPGLTRAGHYTLANLRLVRDEMVAGQLVERTVLDVSPSVVDVEVIDEILITSVTTRPLTLDEIRQKGIVLDADDYLGFEFTLAMKLESTPVNVSFPVVFDREGVALPTFLTPPAVSRTNVPMPTIVPVLLAAYADGEGGGGARIPLTLEGGQEVRIPSVIVIPGNVGYLKQFFSAQLFVANGAPAGARLTVRDITGTIALPTGLDAELGTDDDPLSLAQTAAGESGALAIRGLGLDGQPGTADDRADLGPGEQGQAEFLIRGEKEGFHAISFDIEAALDGLPIGPVTVTGKASGGVLVRNPYYDITFTAPAVVRDGEMFDLYATVTNIGQGIANDLTLTLDASRMSGLHLTNGGGLQRILTLRSGDAATLKFRFTSERTGKVVASYLRFDTANGSNGTTGALNFTVGVGERGVPLSPDTLVLPAVVDELPETLVSAAMRVLGQAWSAANAPPGTLRPGVTRPSKEAVVGKALALAEAGLRRTLGQAEGDALGDLAYDWYVGAPPNRPAATLDAGLDQIHRETDAGHALARAFGAALAPAANAVGPLAYEEARARLAASGPDFASFVINGATGDITLEDASGRRSLVSRTVERGVLAVPGAAFLPLGSAPDAPVLGLVTRPLSSRYTIGFESTSAVAVSTTSPSGDGRRLAHAATTFAPEGARVEATVQIDLTRSDRITTAQVYGAGEVVQPVVTTPIDSQGPNVVSATIIGPETLDSAGPFGLNALVLFDRLVDPSRAALPATYAITRDGDGAIANAVVGAEAVLSGRFVALSLAQPEGPNVAMRLAVAGLPDARGVVGAGSNVLLGSRLVDAGAVVTGRVQQADGTPVAGSVVYANNTDVVTCYPNQGNSGLARAPLDASGRYEFRYVRQDNCGFPFTIASADPQTGGRTEQSRHVRTAGEHIVVDFTLFARGSVTGIVRDLPTNRPVPNARVVAISVTDPQVGGVATTDGEGRYFIPGITVGAVTVRAAIGTSAGANSGHIFSPGMTASVDVVLDGGTVTASGRVRSQAGAPLRGAVVVYYLRPLTSGPVIVAAGTTNELGDYRFEGLPIGPYTLSVRYDSVYEERRGTAAAGDPLHADFNLALPQTGTVVGQVLFPDDSGAADVLVSITGRGALTDAHGRFRIPGVPVGSHSLIAATANERQQGTAPVTVAAGVDSDQVIVRLSGLGHAEFIVLGPDGQPVTDATVVLGGNCGDPCGCVSATTASGRARFENLRLGPVTAKVIRSTGGVYDSASTSVTLLTNGVTVTGTIQLLGFGTVRGVVRQANDLFAHGADIVVRARRFVNDGVFQCGMTTSEFRVVTDAQGNYQVSNVGLGAFTITATHPFAQTAVTASGELTPTQRTQIVNLRLLDTTAGELTGTVFLPDGVTPAGANVAVTIAGRLPDITVRTGVDGRYRFARILPEGRYVLTARDPSTGGQVQQLVQLSVGQAVDQPLRLKGRGTLTINVVDAAGEPVRPALIKIAEAEFPSQRFERSLTGDAATRVRVDGVFEGPLSIEASDPNGRGARLSTDIPRDGAVVEVTVQLNPVGTVTGLFRGPDGLPAPFATVRLRSGNRVIGQATTGELGDERGRFRFDFVPTGAFQVDAEDPATARTGRADGTLASQGATADVVIDVQRLGSVFGIARSNGVEQAGAVVEVVTGKVLPIVTRTDADGRYRVDGVPVGEFVVNASLDGQFLRGSQAGALPDVEGGEVQIDVALRGSRPVTGIVRTAHGDPARFARVTVSVDANGGQQTESTDADGVYRFLRVPTGIADFTVVAAGGVDMARLDDVEIVPASVGLDVPITLVGVGTLEGRIVDGSGNAVSGMLTVTPAPHSLALPRSIVVDGTGRFALPEYLAGTVTLSASSSGLTFTLQGQVSTIIAPRRPGDPITVQDVTLEDAGTVIVRVRRANGTVATGASVQIGRTPFGAVRSVLADGDGVATFRGVPLGDFAGVVTHVVSGGAALVVPFTMSSEAQIVERDATLDEDVFRVLSVVPTDGTTEVSPFAPVSVTFSHPLGQWGNGVSLRTAANGGVSASASLSADRRTVTLTPTQSWPLSTTLTVYLDQLGLVTDAYGRRPQPVDSRFTTAAQPPLTAVMVSPLPGSADVALDAEIVVRFSVPMVYDGLRVTEAGGPFPQRTVTPSENNTVFTIRPLGAWQSDRTFTVDVVASSALDTFGRMLPQSLVLGTFRTVDVRPPSLVSRTPENGASNVPVSAAIAVTFDEPIAVTDLANAVVVTAPNGARAAGTASIENDTQLVFRPTSGLDADTGYTVRVGGIADLLGNRRLFEDIWSFSTTDTVAPTLTLVSPIGTTFDPTPRILISWTDTLSGVDLASAVLRLDGQPVVPLTRASEMEFTPVTLLDDGVHTIEATVADRAGNVAPMLVRTFTVSRVSPSVRVTFLTATGAPIPGQLVEFGAGNGIFSRSGITNASGAVLFTQVPEGSFYTYVNDSEGNRGQVFKTGTITADDYGLVREVVLYRNFIGTIVARAFAAGGTPLPGATLQLDCWEGCQLRTGSDGTITLEDRRVSAVDGLDILAYYDLSSSSTSTRLTATARAVMSADGDTAVVDFVFPLSVVRGAARFTDGAEPTLESVSANVTNQSGDPETYFGRRLDGVSGGYVIFGLPAGAFTVWVQDGESRLVGTAAGTLGDVNVPAALDVRLEPSGTVTGSVLYGPEQPAPFAQVYVTNTTVGVSRSVTADDAGRFTISHVALGDIVVDAYTGVLSGTAPGVITDDQQSVVVDVVLPPIGAVTGVVRDATGVPVANVPVTIRSSGFGYDFSTLTDDQGVYRQDYVPLGAITVRASRGNGITGTVSGSLETLNATATIDVALPATGRIVARLQQHDGMPVAFPTLYGVIDDEPVYLSSDPAGTEAAVGDIVITGRSGYLGVQTTVSVTAGQVLDVTLTLPQPVSISVQVLFGNTSTPWAGSAGMTFMEIGNTYPTSMGGSLDAQGRRTFVGLPPGEFTVSARRCGPPFCTWEVASETVTVAAGETRSITLRLFPE